MAKLGSPKHLYFISSYEECPFLVNSILQSPLTSNLIIVFANLDLYSHLSRIFSPDQARIYLLRRPSKLKLLFPLRNNPISFLFDNTKVDINVFFFTRLHVHYFPYFFQYLAQTLPRVHFYYVQIPYKKPWSELNLTFFGINRLLPSSPSNILRILFFKSFFGSAIQLFSYRGKTLPVLSPECFTKYSIDICKSYLDKNLAPVFSRYFTYNYYANSLPDHPHILYFDQTFHLRPEMVDISAYTLFLSRLFDLSNYLDLPIFYKLHPAAVSSFPLASPSLPHIPQYVPAEFTVSSKSILISYSSGAICNPLPVNPLRIISLAMLAPYVSPYVRRRSLFALLSKSSTSRLDIPFSFHALQSILESCKQVCSSI